MRRELLEQLARMLARSRRISNDVGPVRRLRGAGEDFIDEAPGGFVRGDVYPQRLFHVSTKESVHRTPYGGSHWDNDAAAAGPIGDDYDDILFVDPWGELRMRRPNSAVEKAQGRWNVDNPVAKSLLLGTAGGGGALTLREALAQRMSA